MAPLGIPFGFPFGFPCISPAHFPLQSRSISPHRDIVKMPMSRPERTALKTFLIYQAMEGPEMLPLAHSLSLQPPKAAHPTHLFSGVR